MNVAVVHYHLSDGGVSTVIHASRAMVAAAGVRQVVFTGGGSSADWHRRVDGLGYGVPEMPVESVLAGLRDAAREAFGADPDLWHFHNHSLGRNPLYHQLVSWLYEDGARLLLHIHDLAEDGRPDNARQLGDRSRLYPVGPRVHYAFLNGRDLCRFAGAGLPAENVHLLPNPVVAGPVARRGPAALRMLAPVRGIRRKNLGELVMLALLAPHGCRVAVTRAPRDPAARVNHDAWMHFATEAEIPIDFAVVDRIKPEPGAGSTFDDWLAHASHIVTTSVAEGFGLPIHEAAAWGRPVLGRSLQQIGAGQPGTYYDRLLVPVDWLDDRLLCSLMQRAVADTHAAWGRRAPHAEFFRVLDAMRFGDFIEFSKLPEILQRMAIRRAMRSGERGRIRIHAGGNDMPACEWLENTLADASPAAVAPHDHQAAVAGIYQKLAGAGGPGKSAYLNPARILDDCLKPGNFHYLTSTVKRGSCGGIRAVVFDVYGTLLEAPAGGVKPDPAADARLREIIRAHGHEPPESPSMDLHHAVRRCHAAAGHAHPEVDLRQLWRDLLGLGPDDDTTGLVLEIEAAWHPARLMPGAADVLEELVAGGIPLGLLSNAQCNMLYDLGAPAGWFEPDLTILSYRHRIAKPAPELFRLILERLAARGIAPAEVLMVGNDPLHDIAPAAAVGMRTALFTGHPASLRPGKHAADLVFNDWSELSGFMNLARLGMVPHNDSYE
jgi:FMN phosphatase YigB (HAD superfamily)